MKNKHHSKNTKGLYIALCCFAFAIAAIGYAGGKKDDAPPVTDTHQIAAEALNTEKPYTDENKSAALRDETEILTVSDFSDNEDTISQDAAPPIEEKELSVSKNLEIFEPTFQMPVDGKVITSFTGEALVYNTVLSDWRTHNGIDISCDKNAAIYCAADGVVDSIYEDSMGICVKIKHSEDFETIYSNLSEQIEISEGDEISKGTLIGKIGDTAVADFSSEPHLHFELLHNGAFADPIIYIDN